jgi:hypothetical protein
MSTQWQFMVSANGMAEARITYYMINEKGLQGVSLGTATQPLMLSIDSRVKIVSRKFVFCMLITCKITNSGAA